MNDTTCFTEQVDAKIKNLILLNACHVVFDSDQVATLAHSYGAGILPAYYNFDQDDSTQLEFYRNKDTVIVRLLYQVFEQGYRILPDTIICLEKNVYHLKQKEVLYKKVIRSRGLKFEEFYYVFLLPSNISSPVFYSSFPTMDIKDTVRLR